MPITSIAVVAEDGERYRIRKVVITRPSESEFAVALTESPPSYFLGSIECKAVDARTFDVLDGSGMRLRRV